jgi:hypothetical protein
MTPALRQLRDGTKAHIAESPSVIIPMRMPLIDDGFGGKVRSGTPAAQPKARVRLAHESGSVQKDGNTPTGLGTSLSMYVLTDYSCPLLEEDTFVAEGEYWRVGAINIFRRRGGIYKTEAPLIRTTPLGAS